MGVTSYYNLLRHPKWRQCQVASWCVGPTAFFYFFSLFLQVASSCLLEVCTPKEPWLCYIEVWECLPPSPDSQSASLRSLLILSLCCTHPCCAGVYVRDTGWVHIFLEVSCGRSHPKKWLSVYFTGSSGAHTVLLLASRRFSSDHRNYRRGEKRLVTWFSLFYMSLFHPSYLLLFLLLLFLCLLLTQPILFPMIRMMPNLPRDGHGCSSFQEYSLVSCTTWLQTQTRFLQSRSHSSYNTCSSRERYSSNVGVAWFCIKRYNC